MSELSDLEQWVQDFHEQLELEDLMPKTVINYKNYLAPFIRWARANDLVQIEEITSRDLRRFLSYRKRVDGLADSSRQQEQITINKFLKWVIEEDPEIFDSNPMDKVKRIVPPKKLKPFTNHVGVQALLNTCERNTFTNIRDRALIRAFRDTGIRATEMVSAHIDHVHLSDLLYEVVQGKGGKSRVVPFSDDTAEYIERYLKERSKRRYAHLPQIWITGQGPLTYHACYMMFQRRCIKAGTEPIAPHELRHLRADTWKRKGGSDDGLMTLMGWETRAMLDLYAAATREERALEEAREMFKKNTGAKEE